MRGLKEASDHSQSKKSRFLGHLYPFALVTCAPARREDSREMTRYQGRQPARQSALSSLFLKEKISGASRMKQAGSES